MESKESGHDLIDVISQHLRQLRKTKEDIGQERQCPGQHYNPAPPEYMSIPLHIYQHIWRPLVSLLNLRSCNSKSAAWLLNNTGPWLRFVQVRSSMARLWVLLHHHNVSGYKWQLQNWKYNLTTLLHSSAGVGCCYVARRRSQGSLNFGSTAINDDFKWLMRVFTRVEIAGNTVDRHHWLIFFWQSNTSSVRRVYFQIIYIQI
jgi:hypothetical protein